MPLLLPASYFLPFLLSISVLLLGLGTLFGTIMVSPLHVCKSSSGRRVSPAWIEGDAGDGGGGGEASEQDINMGILHGQLYRSVPLAKSC